MIFHVLFLTLCDYQKIFATSIKNEKSLNYLCFQIVFLFFMHGYFDSNKVLQREQRNRTNHICPLITSKSFVLAARFASSPGNLIYLLKFKKRFSAISEKKNL